jgi:valyl-tRNA synthetase
MPHDLPKAYDPAAIEDHWAEYWVREKLFAQPTPKAADQGDPFTILLPPPNVTGRLHMGHMLNQTEMDILVRWRRMTGRRALWLPGTDHAGIATQMMVERQLTAEAPNRRRHPRPDEAPRRIRRLAARILHHGRESIRSRARSLRPPA